MEYQPLITNKLDCFQSLKCANSTTKSQVLMLSDAFGLSYSFEWIFYATDAISGECTRNLTLLKRNGIFRLI